MSDNSDIPDFQTLMRPILTIGCQGMLPAREAVEQLSEQFGLDEEQRTRLIDSGRQPVIFNRVHWAITYLVKAGALVRPKRGHFETTERGRALLRQHPDRVRMDDLKRFSEFEAFRTARSAGKDDTVEDRPTPAEEAASEQTVEEQTPEERIEAAVSEMDDALREELLALILEASPTFFERLVVDLLVAMGYGGSRSGAAKRIGRTNDEGIDGVINEDALGLDVVYIQAKRYDPANTISRDKIQQFAGALVGQGASKGVFVTTSSYSRHAVEYAARVPQRIVLVDGRDLTEHMMRYQVGVRIERTYEHRKVDRDYFDASAV